MEGRIHQKTLSTLLIVLILIVSCGKRGTLIPRNELVPYRPRIKKIFVDDGRITIFFRVPPRKIQHEKIRVRSIEFECTKWKKVFPVNILQRFKNLYALTVTGNFEYFRLRPWSEYGAGKFTRWFYIPENPLKKKPIISSIKLIENGVQFSWHTSEKVEGIIIYIGREKGPLNLFNIQPIKDKRPAITSLPLHRFFHIVIQGAITCEKNFLCLSPLSEEATIYTKDIIPPPSPSDLNLISKNGKIYLFWTQVNAGDLKEYRIYRKSNLHAKWKIIGKTRNNRFVDSGCGKEKKCYYTITAIDTDGNESGFSNIAVTGGENEPFHLQGK